MVRMRTGNFHVARGCVETSWLVSRLKARPRTRDCLVNSRRDAREGICLPSSLILSKTIVLVRTTGINVAAEAVHLLVEHATLVIIIIAHALRALLDSNIAGVPSLIYLQVTLTSLCLEDIESFSNRGLDKEAIITLLEILYVGRIYHNVIRNII